MKNDILSFVLLSAFFITACQEGGSKTDDKNMSADTVVTGLEGSRDQSGQLLTDVKPDTTSGQSDNIEPLGQRADSINAKGISSSPDQEFVHDAVNGNTEEIGMAKLAKAQGANKEIRSVAAELEQDHTTALKDLNALSNKKKYSNASNPLHSSASNDISSLKSKKGVEFDKAWCSVMIEKHKSTIAKYEANEKSISDLELKSWISKNLPKLRMHNDHLMAIHGKL